MTRALSAGGCDWCAKRGRERSYPTSEVRGRSREDPMPEGLRPRRVTPCPRSGAAAESARLGRRRTGREELPRSEVREAGRGGGGAAERRYPASEVRGGGQEEIPHALKPEARGGGREEQPPVQGAVAAWAQEGLEELSHVKGQEGRWCGDTPHPK